MEKSKINKVYMYGITLFIILISILIRISYMPTISNDYTEFLSKWFDLIKENNGIFALKMNFGDYNMPYVQIIALLTYLPINSLYSIKVVSIIFDYIGSIGVGLLIYEITKDKNKAIIGFFITIMLPTIILNSSAWAQCDFLYVTFIIFSLLFLLKDKYILSFAFLGVSFAFKLQTIFVLPMYFLYYASDRKFPFYYFFIIPLVDIVLCLPSIIVGKPLYDLLSVYINQTGEYSEYISLNFPGIYPVFFKTIGTWVEMPNKVVKYLGILIPCIIYFIFAIIVFLKKIKFSKESIIKLAVWSIIFSTYLLPQMHDRYMFAADVISIAVFVIDSKKWYLPVIVNMASLYTYMSFLFGIRTINIRIVSILLGIVLVYYTFSIFKELNENNKSIKVEKKDDI